MILFRNMEIGFRMIFLIFVLDYGIGLVNELKVRRKILVMADSVE